MKSVKRQSISEEFQFHCCEPVPCVPLGGARIKVFYAGACYTDPQVVRSGQRRPRMPGVQDTSLFPGFEVSGVIDELCPSVTAATQSGSELSVGDRVIVYPTCEEQTEDGYSEYLVVKDVGQLVKIPDSLAMDIAAMLPCGGLMAYSAVERIRPFVAERLKQFQDEIVNVLIVGAGGLSLWVLKLAEHYLGDNSHRVRIIVSDSNIDKLHLAKEEGCYDIVECKDELHEEYIAMRMKNVCKGGVDVAIDFVSSARTVTRTLNVLKENGLIIVGGNSKFEVPINLHSLAIKSQSVLGVHRGTRDQLEQLVHLVANDNIKPPKFRTFPVDQANLVFQKLSQSKLFGRAVFRVFGDGDDSVFFRNDADDDGGGGSPSSNQFHASSFFDLENGYCSSPDCLARRRPLLETQVSRGSVVVGSTVDAPIFTL